MATVIAFANQKGGVGKTTLSTQFAYHLALKEHHRILFLDMDAQGSATETLLEGIDFEGTVSQELFSDYLEDICVQPTPRGIDLIGSLQTPEAYDVEALPLHQVLNPTKYLSASLLDHYDYAVIDCPPSLGRRLAASLVLADFVVCPIKLSGYAVSGLKSLFSTIVQIKNSSNERLQILGVAINEFQEDAVQRDALAAVSAALPGYLFNQKIHHRSPIDIASRGKPVFEVRNGQRAASELENLFSEMLSRIASHQQP